MSRLLDALRKRFKRPEDAIEALGLDAALIAMDAAFEEGSHPRDETGKFASSASGGNPTKGEQANLRREHQEAQVFHGKMARHHAERGEHEHAAAHRDASEAHGEAAEVNRWGNKSGKSTVYSSQAAREASIHANHKSGYGEGFANDRKPLRVAGDSKERASMTTTKPNWSPTALVALGALQNYIEPRLAQDAAIDFKPILRGVTARNFRARRPLIASQIRSAVQGNLAADADVEDLGEVLDRIDQLADEGREALGEARADEGEDAPEDQTEGLGSGEMEGAGEEGGGEDDANEIREFLSDKLSPEDLETVCAMMKAKGEDEDPDEKKDEEKKEPVMDRKAMDAAIRTSVAAAIRANDRKHADIAAARAEVRPYVGELTIGCDSAEAVYRHALTAMGVDVKDVHRDALAPILRAQPRPGGGTRPAEARIAHDAAGAKSFNDMFPGAARIGTA